MIRFGLSLFLLMPLVASAQVNDSLPDPTVERILRPSLFADIAGNTQLSWREMEDLDALDEYIHSKDANVNRQFLEGEVVVVSARRLAVESEAIPAEQISDIKVVAGSAFQNKNSESTIYLACRTADCRTHRAIERVLDDNDVPAYYWRGPEYRVFAVPLDAIVHGNPPETGLRIYINRLHKLVYFGTDPVRHQEIYRYLNLAGVLNSTLVPSAREAMRAKPTQRLDQSTWVRVKPARYWKLMAPFKP